MKGGLVYTVRKKQEEYQQVQGSVMDNLLNDENAILDLDMIMKRINSDGTTLSVDDILWREKYILPSEGKQAETQPVELSPDAKPVIVTDIHSSCEDTSNPLLDDLTREINRPFSPVHDVVLIHRDVLDEEGDEREDVAEEEIRQVLSQQKAVVQNPDDVFVMESSPSPLRPSPPLNSSPLLYPSALSNSSPLLHPSVPNSSPLLQPAFQPSPPPTPSPASRRESLGSSRTIRPNREVSIRSAKENIVCPEKVIHEQSISA